MFDKVFIENQQALKTLSCFLIENHYTEIELKVHSQNKPSIRFFTNSSFKQNSQSNPIKIFTSQTTNQLLIKAYKEHYQELKTIRLVNKESTKKEQS